LPLIAVNINTIKKCVFKIKGEKKANFKFAFFSLL